METSKYQKRIGEHQRLDRRKAFKRVLKSVSILILEAGTLVLVGWYVVKFSSGSKEEIISRIGLHWHPELFIFIKGEKVEIPVNIGLYPVENPVHTHDGTGIIHLEFPGLVAKESLRLGNFFDIWGKKFNQNCIFDYCNGPDGSVKFSVNGQPNADFDNYIMRDKDKIEIRYE